MSDACDVYMENLEFLTRYAVQHDLYAEHLLEGPPGEIADAVARFTQARESLLSVSDYDKVEGYLELGFKGYVQISKKVAAFCSLFELNESISLARMQKSCAPYDKEQPLFKSIPSLWRYVREPDNGSPELIDAHSIDWDDSGQIARFGELEARLSGWIRPDLAMWLRHEFSSVPVFLRLDPYTVGQNLEPLLLEEVVRPANPNWWKHLDLWPRTKTLSRYELFPCSPSENLARYWEHAVRNLGVLDVIFRRMGNGTLSGMIEEVERPRDGRYVLGFCIHLTSTAPIGTDWDAAQATHIDGAINVYVDARIRERASSSLDTICNATFRTHVFRVDSVPLRAVLPICERFFRSQALLEDWFSDQFQGLCR